MLIYHNPRCSKSRQTLKLLEENGVDPEVVEYLKTPPTKKRIGEIIDALGIDAHDLLRKKETAYEEAGLSKDSSKKDIINAIAAHPILMERPVVYNSGKAVLGRPPENALELL